MRSSQRSFTRITIVTSGDELILEQIEKQLAKLEDVVDIKVLEPNESVQREMMLVKIAATKDDRQDILALTSMLHAKVVDVTPRSIIIEVAGRQEKLESFLENLEGYEILELARTGLTGLSRRSDDVVIIE